MDYTASPGGDVEREFESQKNDFTIETQRTHRDAQRKTEIESAQAKRTFLSSLTLSSLRTSVSSLYLCGEHSLPPNSRVIIREICAASRVSSLRY